jgi:hypothetical protein
VAPRQRHHRLGRLAGAVEVEHAEAEFGALAVDRHQRRGRHAVAEPSRRPQRLAVEVDRLAQAERLRRLVGGLQHVIERALPVLGLREVMGQHLVVLGEPVTVELLDGAADEGVQLLAALDEQRGVGDVLRQRVLEHVRQLRE